MKKLAGGLVLVVTLLVQVALAAISVDTSGSFTDGSNSPTHTLTGFTVASQSDRVLIATYGSNDVGLASSITFNGDSLTNIAGADVTTGGSAASGIYYRIAPDIATGDVELTLFNTPRGGVCALSLFGADQSSPITDSDETTGNTETSGTLTLTTVAGDYVVYAIEVRDENGGLGALDHTAGSASSETEIADLVLSGNERHGCSYVVASGTSTQIGYSWNVSTEWALVAVVVTPSAIATTSKDMSLIGVGR